MSEALEILVLLIALGSLVIAYFSAKTWRIYQVILVVLILFGTMGFSYLAARTLKTHQTWRSLAQERQQELEKIEKENRELLEGVSGERDQLKLGIKQLKQDLERISLERGGVYYDVAPDKIDVSPEKVKAGTAAVQVTIESPDPHGIPVKTIVYVFEQTGIDKGGQYLGEFKVTTAPEKSKSLLLSPNLPMTERELRRLASSKGPWIFYLMMPIDNPRVFATATDDEKRELLKGASEDYLQERPARDYARFFQDYFVDRELTLGAIEQVNKNLKATEAALAKAQQEETYRKTEAADLKYDLANFKRERQEVAKLLAALQEQYTALRGELRDTYARNKKMAADFATLQLKASDEINRHTLAEQASTADTATPASP